MLFAVIVSFIFIPAFCGEPSSTYGDSAVRKAIRIIDGDTFELLLDDNVHERIRLYGIDCPERKQPFSKVARDKLAELIFGKQVKIIRMYRDRYGRTVAMVFCGGININEALLTSGLAWHFKRYDQNPAWNDLEKIAASKKIGLWADPEPVPPWEWRKR